jgi:hypothetical protein
MVLRDRRQDLIGDGLYIARGTGLAAFLPGIA